MRKQIKNTFKKNMRNILLCFKIRRKDKTTQIQSENRLNPLLKGRDKYITMFLKHEERISKTKSGDRPQNVQYMYQLRFFYLYF